MSGKKSVMVKNTMKENSWNRESAGDSQYIPASEYSPVFRQPDDLHNVGGRVSRPVSTFQNVPDLMTTSRIGSAKTYAKIRIQTKHDYFRGTMLVGQGFISQSNRMCIEDFTMRDQKKFVDEPVMLEGFLEGNVERMRSVDEKTSNEYPLGTYGTYKDEPCETDRTERVEHQVHVVKQHDVDLTNLQRIGSGKSLNPEDGKDENWKRNAIETSRRKGISIVVPCHTSDCELCEEYHNDDTESCSHVHTHDNFSIISDPMIESSCQNGSPRDNDTDRQHCQYEYSNAYNNNKHHVYTNHLPKLMGAQPKPAKLYELDHDTTQLAGSGTNDTFPVVYSKGVSKFVADIKSFESPQFSYTKYRTQLL